MLSLRHNKTWLVWLVGLALVITGALSPAQAFACADRPAVAQSAPAPGESAHCAGMEMQRNAPCCCSPGEKLTQAHPAQAGVVHLAARCGCTVHAPDPQPAPATKASVLVFAPELALLAAPAPQIEAPQAALWFFAAPATGPPSSTVRATGPSRAPPAFFQEVSG
jgi:hypothetical protein